MHAMNALCNLKILRLGNILKTENIAFRHIKWRIMKVTESGILAQGEGKEKKGNTMQQTWISKNVQRH